MITHCTNPTYFLILILHSTIFTKHIDWYRKWHFCHFLHRQPGHLLSVSFLLFQSGWVVFYCLITLTIMSSIILNRSIANILALFMISRRKN
jgi:hypothetical protein